jgi:hypothetical protein
MLSDAPVSCMAAITDVTCVMVMVLDSDGYGIRE